jgi:hypothetical protein
MRWPLAVVLAFSWGSLLGQDAQDDDAPPERAMKPPVQLTFTPPALEGPIILGIFNEAGKLERTLHYQPGAPELFVDTNGYIVKWDGDDDEGKPCPAGRYSAHGYMVDESVSVEGVAYHFNDWYAQDNVGASSVSLQEDVPAHELAVRVTPQHEPAEVAAKGQLIALPQPDGSLRWDRRLPRTLEQIRQDFDAGKYPADATWFKGDPGARFPGAGPVWKLKSPPHLEGELVTSVDGRDGTLWAIVKVDGHNIVRQFAANGEVLRELKVPSDEPQPSEILASRTEDIILLAENSANNSVQRVRMLRRTGDATSGKDGKAATDWEVVFERELQPSLNFNLVDGKLVADGGPARQADGSYPLPPNEITVPLVENVLEPGPTKLKLKAVAIKGGSALSSADGLILIPISSDGDWFRFALAKGDKVGEATLYQANYCVVEEFSLKNLDHIAAFDAGSFLLAPSTQ